MKRLILLGLLPWLVWAGGNKDLTDWPAALEGIESGDGVWLARVPDLAASADIRQAIGLEDALSSALSKNTPAVLNTLSIIDAQTWPHMIGTDIVCGVPAEQSAAVVEDFYQRTREALLDTRSGANCLWFLEVTYREWKAENSRTVK